MPLADKGQEACGEGTPTVLGVPTQPSLITEGREQENGGWAGISHKGVLVINGSGVAPFFSVAP